MRSGAGLSETYEKNLFDHFRTTILPSIKKTDIFFCNKE
jgi:hypothetical protein